MFKTIALAAAAGALVIGASPAAAGPGVVLQGKSVNGINLQGVAAREAVQTRLAPLPVTAPSIPAVDGEPVGKPTQAACTSCGTKSNGRALNGITWNGKFLNGTRAGAPATVEHSATFTVGAVTLPGGKRIVVQ